MSGVASVREISECFIKPKHDVVLDESNKFFYLGSFELGLMSHCYNQKGFVFHNLPSEEDGGMDLFLERLKQSLCSTLVHFYPLAGQFVTQVDEDQRNSSIYIDCNKGRGAKFIHAALDNVTVNDILSPNYVPTTIIQSFFELGSISTNYDAHDEPMLVIQVTELADGIFLGVSMNHATTDGSTLLHFLSSWSEIFQSNSPVISRHPICERWFPQGCGPVIKIPFTRPDEFITRHNMSSFNANPISEAFFYFSSQSIATLKAKANAECGLTDKISSVQALSAILWRSMVRSRGLKSDETTTCFIIANCRSRLLHPPLSLDYFGCFIAPIIKCVKVGELLGNNLGRVAMLLHEAVVEFDDARVRDKFTSWVRAPSFPKAGEEDPNSIEIAGIPRSTDVNNMEFGLGKVVASRSAGYKYSGKVTLRPGEDGKGSISFDICLSPDAMTAFQQDTELVSFLS